MENNEQPAPQDSLQSPGEKQEINDLGEDYRKEEGNYNEVMLMISPLIDELILKTPTGLNRNKLCDINIIIKAALLGGKLSGEPTPSKTADEVREEIGKTVFESYKKEKGFILQTSWEAAKVIYTQFIEPRDRELERLRKESASIKQKEQ